MHKVYKWLLLVVSLSSLLVLSSCKLPSFSKMAVTNGNINKIKNGTYYMQPNKNENYVVDINQTLKKIDHSNPYQGVTFKRVNDNVVQVVSHGEVVPHLYEVLKQPAVQAKANPETFTAQAANMGDYVANNDPKNLQSAINYAVANTFNDNHSLTQSQLYQKLTHAGLYRPAFNAEIAKQAINKVYHRINPKGVSN